MVVKNKKKLLHNLSCTTGIYQQLALTDAPQIEAIISAISKMNNHNNSHPSLTVDLSPLQNLIAIFVQFLFSSILT